LDSTQQEMVSVTPCPQCGNPLHVTARLHGCHLRCRMCSSVLGVVVVRHAESRESAPERAEVAGRDSCSVQPAHSALPASSNNGRKKHDMRRQRASPPLAQQPPATKRDGPETSPKTHATRPKTAAPASNAAAPAPEAAAPDASAPTSDAPTAARSTDLSAVDVLQYFSVDDDEELAAPSAAPRTETAKPPPDMSLPTQVSAEGGPEPEPDSQEADQPKPSAAAKPARVEWSSWRSAAAPRGLRRFSHSPAPDTKPVPWRLIASSLLAVAVLSVGGWWWSLSSGACDPHAKYLPQPCDLFVSLNWKDLQQTAATRVSKDLPGFMLVERARVFLANAGLKDRDVERVTAGRAADGSGLIVVYHLTLDVEPKRVVDRQRFREFLVPKGPRDVVRDVTVYSLGATALAFPEPQVIINGETELVRDVLRRPSAGIAQPLDRLLSTLDFSSSSVVAAADVSESFRAAFLDPNQSGVRGPMTSTTSCRYGATIRYQRTLGPQQTAPANVTVPHLQQAIQNLARDSRTSKPAQTLLEAVQVTTADGQVQLRLEMPDSALGPDTLEFLRRLF
jgi:hypothetical protein